MEYDGNSSISRRVCAFCNSLLDEHQFNDSICGICAERYGIDAYSSDDGCACDSR